MIVFDPIMFRLKSKSLFFSLYSCVSDFFNSLLAKCQGWLRGGCWPSQQGSSAAAIHLDVDWVDRGGCGGLFLVMGAFSVAHWAAGACFLMM